MANNLVPFTDLLSTIVDNRGRTCPVSDHGLPLIATNCISNDALYPKYETTRFVDEETYRNWFRGHPLPGDILFVCKGSPGRTNWVPDPVDFCIAQDMVAVRADAKKVYPKYLLAVLRSQPVQQQIENMHVGTMIPHFKKGDFDKLQIPLVNKAIQEAIGDIYFSFLEKIEINRRMNETLEAMARALFKAWFVDFEPVRAKMEGRWQRGQSLSGLPAHLYDLFPDRFVESELGEIPEGWEVQCVADIGTIVCGKTPSTKISEYYGEDVPFITIPEMHGNIFAVDIKKKLSHAGANSQPKKMLPSGSICVSCIATLGLVTITTETSQTNQQINSVVPYEKDSTYYWYWILRELGGEIKAGGSGGSVLGNLSTGRFADLKVNASSKQLREIYNTSIMVAFSRILENERESLSLTKIRDILLPKLISGELRIDTPKAIAEQGE